MFVFKHKLEGGEGVNMEFKNIVYIKLKIQQANIITSTQRL